MSESRVDPEIIKAALRATYDAAADHFDAAPLSFWELCGRRTVELAGIEPGASVLDVRERVTAITSDVLYARARRPR